MLTRTLGFLLAVPLAALPATVRDKMLVSTDWLNAHLKDPRTIVLQVSRDKAAYDAGHIPGARLVMFNDLVTTRGGIANELPPVADLQKVFERAGVSDKSRIVLYGDTSVLNATRAYFTLDYLGHGDHAALLDGGLEKWKAENRPLSKETPPAMAGRLTPRPRPGVVASIEDVKRLSAEAKNAGAAILVDSRPAPDYAGTKPPEANARVGHIPGAVSAYWQQAQASADSPALKPAAELRKMYESAGVSSGRKAVTYCNSGVQATHGYFTLKYLGYDVRMYDGSFSEWIKAPGTAVEK